MICGTSAGTKSSYAYSLLCETFIQAIIDPSNAFVMGLDYRLPAKHGLVDGKFVERQKFSSSYNEATFAAEYGGVWQGGSNEAWFDFEKLTKYRKKKNPEWKQVYEETANVFYLVSVDVGRLHDQTVATVFRVNISNGKYYCTVVNIYVLGRQGQQKTFSQQAIDIKLLIERYKPREVLIDCNGLGRHLCSSKISLIAGNP